MPETSDLVMVIDVGSKANHSHDASSDMQWPSTDHSSTLSAGTVQAIEHIITVFDLIHIGYAFL